MALLPLNILEIAGQMPAEVTDETLMAAAITEKPAGLMKTLFGPYITKATPAIFSTLGPYKAHGITGTDWIDRITDIGLFNRLHIAMRKDPHVGHRMRRLLDLCQDRRRQNRLRRARAWMGARATGTRQAPVPARAPTPCERVGARLNSSLIMSPGRDHHLFLCAARNLPC